MLRHEGLHKHVRKPLSLITTYLHVSFSEEKCLGATLLNFTVHVAMQFVQSFTFSTLHDAYPLAPYRTCRMGQILIRCNEFLIPGQTQAS